MSSRSNLELLNDPNPMTVSPSGNTTFLYLVRHGSTDANLKRPYILQGRGMDLSLNEVGCQQAQAVGEFLSQWTLQQVYSSGMKRAIETAEQIAKHHELEVQPVEQLAECHVGNWEGMDWESIEQEHPEAYRAFMENPALNPYLGGESYHDVQLRVQPVLQQLLERHVGESIAVVAHNVVNRVYLAGLLGVDLSRAKDLRQTNAGVNVIRYREGETALMTMNAHFHLDESLLV
jgi:broad specificity phosphatase PhoE